MLRLQALRIPRGLADAGPRRMVVGRITYKLGPYGGPGLTGWNFQLGVTAGHRGADRGHDPIDMRPDQHPIVGAEHQNGDLSAAQLLLVAQFLIGGDEEVKAGFLRSVEEGAILEARPTLKPNGND